jgi:hypothetical protein
MRDLDAAVVKSEGMRVLIDYQQGSRSDND